MSPIRPSLSWPNRRDRHARNPPSSNTGRSCHRTNNWLLAGLLSATLAGCGGDPFWLPPAHRINIQQGNLITAEQLEALEPGLARGDVRRLIGSPVAHTPFHDTRWDYLYTRGPAGSVIEARRLSLHFEGDTLARIDSNHDSVDGELDGPPSLWQRWFPPASEEDEQGRLDPDDPEIDTIGPDVGTGGVDISGDRDVEGNPL